MSSKQGPFVFTAAVIVGCLAVGLASVVFAKDVPSLVVSVILACGVATLLYGIIGGVSEAGFDFGPLKVGGSAAVLLGGAWLFNQLLDPQLSQIRKEARVERYAFVLGKHAKPPDGWFAIDKRDGVPIKVEFTDPVTGNTQAVESPDLPQLPLKLAEEEGRQRYLVLGTGADVDQSFGYVNLNDLVSAVGSVGGMKPGTVYGPSRLYMATGGQMPDGLSSSWGDSGSCRGMSMPFLIEVKRFHDGFADYDLTSCGTSGGAAPDHSSSLKSGVGELVDLTIEGRKRNFLIAVVAADHRKSPLWSSFLAIEMEAGR